MLSRLHGASFLLALGLLSCGNRRASVDSPALQPLSAERRDALGALRAAQSTRDPRFALVAEAGVFSGSDASFSKVRFDTRGLHLSSSATSFDVRLARWGRAATLTSVPEAVPVAGKQPNEIGFHRGAIHEWYKNGPAGLEQGFEIATPPKAAPGPVVLELAVSGLRPAIDGATVSLRNPEGTVASISDLLVVDADGHEVPSRFAVDGGNVRLEIEDAGAHYPLSVDPIIGIGQVLKPSDGSVASGGFGYAVRARGDRVIVGAFRHNVGAAAQAGAAYVYVRSGTSWVFEGKLTAPTPVAYDEFGQSVDIDNDTAVASSWKNNAQRGAVYVFKRSGSTWSYYGTLTIAGALGGIGLGNAIALDGGYLVATSQATTKKFWVFNSFTTGASPLTSVTSSDTTLTNWGLAVGFQGSTIVVGCPDFSSINSSVVVHTGGGSSWAYQTKMAFSGISWGRSVDVDGTALIVYGNKPDNTAAGAYIFRNKSTGWALEQTVWPAGLAGKYNSGSVAISGEVALVSGADSGAGAATIYQHAGSTIWNEIGKLTPVGGVAAGYFNSVGLDGDTAIAGAYQANTDAVSSSGAAYVYYPVLAWPNGHACVDANQCSSGLCVDGYCCNTACTESCKACSVGGSLGTCTAVPAGAPVGSRTCSPAKVCAAGGVCSSACTATSDCASGFYCNGTTCVAKKGAGAGCSAAAECTSGFCADGVCCNTACTGQCEACDVTSKNGTCTPVVGAPRPSKTKCAGATTGSDADCAATCNGVDATACHYAGTTIACGKDACTAGVESKVGKCDGAGKCTDTTRLCSPFACSGTVCGVACTSKSDCAAGYSCKGSVCVASDSLGAACTGSGDCLDGLFCTDGVCCGVADCGADKSCSAKPSTKGTCFSKQGATCATDAECASGFCVDGVCCDTKCDGQCEACDMSGDGTCGPVTGAPHGARPTCDAGTDVCSARACDGADRATCAGYKAGPSVVCKPAACDGDSLRPESTCDGKGSCAAPTNSSCGKFACDPSTSTCRTTCSSASDCAKGFSCNGGVCSTGATCSDDKLSSVTADGPKPCAPYVCGGDGDCLTTCVSTSDCAPGNACDPASKTCVGSTPDGDSGDSGGCALPRDRRAGSAASIVVAALWALGFAARRRRGAGR